nr:EOG090X0784 [Scapholeberis mucronata]
MVLILEDSIHLEKLLLTMPDWLSLQGPGILQTGDRGHSVPFLPVNAELSATRNQARQKLGRLNAREFATLLIDLLSEAKRRQQGGLIFSLRDLQHTVKPEMSDDEPLYDSVASEEEFVLAEQQQILAEQKLANINREQQDQKSGVSVEAYIDIKEQLALSNSRMQALLASNTNMQTQIAQLQNMVQTLVQENNQLKTQPIPVAAAAAVTAPVNALNGPTMSSKSLEETVSVTMRGSKIPAARHSMYEPREGPRSPQRSTPTTATPAALPKTSDEVIRRTNIITRRIQDVFRNVQERRQDQIEPCARLIVEAVQSMATIIPQKSDMLNLFVSRFILFDGIGMQREESDIAREYPLHYFVWNNNTVSLRSSLLADNAHLQHLEQLDPRGRTPLMLAVTLEHVDCVILLLESGANVNVENKEGWTVVQEAVSTGNQQLLSAVLQKRDLQRHTTRMVGVPALLQKLKEAPDFYMEMKWEFTSWVPLVSRMCPSDTYKVYKQGSNVRIDTTLLGFDQGTWQRGSKSYLFKSEGVDKAVLLEMDHEAKEVFVEELKTLQEDHVTRNLMAPTENALMNRITAPIVHTYVDTDKIYFERNKSGIWGWRSDKTEIVNGRDCKVFSASNVELVTKTRTEHLSPEDKSKIAGSRFPLNSLLTVGQVAEDASTVPVVRHCYKTVPGFHPENADNIVFISQEEVSPPANITLLEYFDPNFDLGNRDIGRPKEMSTKVQKFKATLWLCEEFPLSLVDQIMPIVDLMAISNTHFAKLRDFIQMQLPSEIPLFHVMNACITFGNTFAIDEAVNGISTIQEDDRLSCVVDDICFVTPGDYTVYGLGGASASARHQQFSMDEEDELLQYAIQQSLLDVGSERDQVDIWEALKGQKPNTPQPVRAHRSPLPPRASSSLGFGLSPEEEQLQSTMPLVCLYLIETRRAIEASLGMPYEDLNATGDATSTGTSEVLDEEALLAEALVVSARETQLEEERRTREDTELLQRILELSLLEK